MDDDSEEYDDEYEKINPGDGNDENESEGRGNFDYDVENLIDEFIDVNE